MEKRLKSADSIRDHIKDLQENSEYKSNKSDKTYVVESCNAVDIQNENTRTLMVDMVESSLKEYYINSSWGWSWKDKYNELFSKESHFIIIKQKQRPSIIDNNTDTDTDTNINTSTNTENNSNNHNNNNNHNHNNNNNNSNRSTNENGVAGFVMFRFCYDDDDEPEFPCLYMYELNISPPSRGDGLGKYLVELLFKIQAKWRLWKTMLTCFIDNKDAMQFYKRLGFGIDVYSPSRSEIFQSDGEDREEVKYEILSNRPDATS
jgi:ribosomal protein S18 acetylase RimI-like enzyme